METVISRSPVTGEVFYEKPYSDISAIASSLNKSRDSAIKWARSSLQERKQFCASWLEYILAARDEISIDLTLQIGRPIKHAPFELDGVKERVEYMIEQVCSSLANITIPAPDSKPNLRREILFEPVGVVLVVAPWNYPLLTAVNAIFPAILAGNSVILKHSHQTPLTGETFAKTFQQANGEPGLFQNLWVSHQQTESILQSGEIRVVSFTGSNTGGLALQKAGANNLIRYNLELGGKDPAYVAKDVDVVFAANGLAGGAFYNAGQSCCGIERIYVHNTIYDRFVEAFIESSNKYKLGDPFDRCTTLGPVVSEKSAERLNTLVEQAKTKGAKIIKGGSTSNYPTNCYVPWHIICTEDSGLELSKQEIFGPLVTVASVKTDQEAVELMNDSKYGLTASVWTKDKELAIKLGSELQAGTYFVNKCDYLDPSLPWTGVKNSGLGCSLSSLGFQPYLQPKSVYMDIF